LYIFAVLQVDGLNRLKCAFLLTDKEVEIQRGQRAHPSPKGCSKFMSPGNQFKLHEEEQREGERMGRRDNWTLKCLLTQLSPIYVHKFINGKITDTLPGKI
jgi:hypothetical protein